MPAKLILGHVEQSWQQLLKYGAIAGKSVLQIQLCHTQYVFQSTKTEQVVMGCGGVGCVSGWRGSVKLMLFRYKTSKKLQFFIPDLRWRMMIKCYVEESRFEWDFRRKDRLDQSQES